MRNIEACTELVNTVRSGYGPNGMSAAYLSDNPEILKSLSALGMNKMVINHLEKLFVTSDAATIIKELEVSVLPFRLPITVDQDTIFFRCNIRLRAC